MRYKKDLLCIGLSFMMVASMNIGVYADEQHNLNMYDNYINYIKMGKSVNYDVDSIIFRDIGKDEYFEFLNNINSEIGMEIDDFDKSDYAGVLKIDNQVYPINIVSEDGDMLNLTSEQISKLLLEVSDCIKQKNNEEYKISRNQGMSSYRLVGSAIKLNATSNGKLLYYKEYRWYEGGNNSEVNFYYLRKDFEDKQGNIKDYEASFTPSNNMYSVDTLDPDPKNGSSTKTITVSYPYGISYSFSNIEGNNIATTHSISSDTAWWKVNTASNLVTTLADNFNIKHGYFIESNKNNTKTTISDYTYTNYLESENMELVTKAYADTTKVYINNSGSTGWN